MKNLILILSLVSLMACGRKQSETETTATEKPAVDTLAQELGLSYTTDSVKIEIFRKPIFLGFRLSRTGIGKMRGWHDIGGMYGSSTDYFRFGSEGPNGLANNLAYYLESPSQDYVKEVKLMLNLNNPAEKKSALKRYADVTQKAFEIMNIKMPSGLKQALTSGKAYHYEDKNMVVNNFYNKDRIEWWKLQIMSY